MPFPWQERIFWWDGPSTLLGPRPLLALPEQRDPEAAATPRRPSRRARRYCFVYVSTCCASLSVMSLTPLVVSMLYI